MRASRIAFDSTTEELTQAACWARGARGALNGALRTTIDATNRAAIAAYGTQVASALPTEARDDGESGEP